MWQLAIEKRKIWSLFLMYSLSTIKHVGKKATKILPHVELIVKSHTVQHNQASKKTMQLVILKEISIKLLKKKKEISIKRQIL